MKNNYFSLSLLIVFLVASSNSLAQRSDFIIPLSATSNVSGNSTDWNPVIINLDNEVGDEFADQALLNEQKEKLQKLISKPHHPALPQTSRDILDTPYIGKNFAGNNYDNSVPNDNEIAVSNSGYIISVMNSTIFMYDLNSDTVISYMSLDAFATSLGNTQSKYDPKVIYDPLQNKFIVVFLAGFTHNTSTIIVAFSESDQPGQSWNFYELPGNPLNDTLWSDYPMVALTEHELFITVNHLHDNQPWQTGWVRTVIWQMNKLGGYNGDTLSSVLHDDISFNERGIRNLCPVKGGSKLYGPDIYFLSDRNLDVMNDSIFLVHLSDTINAPGIEVTTQVLKSDIPYFVPVNAKQSAGGDLATNDARVLGAFYENDRIQFVGNTTDTATGTAAIYHGVITDLGPAPSLILQIISDDTIHYAYPNISYAGDEISDNTAIIDMLRSAFVLFPGYSAMVTDGNGSYSPIKNVKDGLSYHSVIPGTERWGDYSGSQRKYDEPGKVWVNGSYATLSHKVETWISEISLDPFPLSINNPIASPGIMNAFPNPFSDNFTVNFMLEKTSDCSFDLFDMNGKLVKILMQERVHPGSNQFSFSLSPVAKGIYLLAISADGIRIASEKVVKD